jgi:diguanylate cyclase (GGDEF)-like protein
MSEAASKNVGRHDNHWRNAPPGYSRSVFERTLDALPDGVLLIDDERNIEYANHAFRVLWRIPEALLATQDDALVLAFVLDQLEDPVQFGREVERLYGSAETSQDELSFKDGRVFSRRSVPLHDGVTNSARIWIFTDITEARSASFDALTGLNNRRAYGRQFPNWIAAPDDNLRAVALMDIDNFKGYNDAYGHAAGDEVLRQVGVLLRMQLCKPDDLAFRIGGEEFLIASGGREAPAVVPFFEAIRRSIVDMKIIHAGNHPHGVVTASFGLAVGRGPKDPASVFQHADAALYRAKRGGRNAIAVVHTDE